MGKIKVSLNYSDIRKISSHRGFYANCRLSVTPDVAASLKSISCLTLNPEAILRLSNSGKSSLEDQLSTLNFDQYPLIGQIKHLVGSDQLCQTDVVNQNGNQKAPAI